MWLHIGRHDTLQQNLRQHVTDRYLRLSITLLYKFSYLLTNLGYEENGDFVVTSYLPMTQVAEQHNIFVS